MNVKQAAAVFDRAQIDELVVVDHAEGRRIIGLLSEAFLLRRYADELDKARRGVAGDA